VQQLLKSPRSDVSGRNVPLYGFHRWVGDELHADLSAPSPDDLTPTFQVGPQHHIEPIRQWSFAGQLCTFSRNVEKDAFDRASRNDGKRNAASVKSALLTHARIVKARAESYVNLM
jgi:hypothetical protein